MKWAKTTIGQHCTVTSSKRFHLSDRSDSGIPFYCSKEIIQKNKGEEITDCDYIKEESYEAVKEQFGVPSCGDLLITTRGTYGIPYIYRETDRFYFADGNLTWLKDFDKNFNAKFIYYWVLSYDGQKKIDAIAKGTAQKAVPIASIKQLEVPYPPIEIQKRIANILSTYDNLIENNQKQIKLLEEAAQRIYKEWFVDLHFPGHEDTPIVDGVPEGWKKQSIGEFLSYEIGGGWGEETPQNKAEDGAFVVRGTDLHGLTHGQLTDIPFRYHSTNNIASRKLEDGDIIFEVSGGSKTEGVARTALIREEMLDYWKSPVMCASFCKLIRPISTGYSQYLFNTFQYLRATGRTGEYDKKSASSIVNYRWKDFLSQELIYKPDENIIRQYNQIAEPVYKEIIIKSLQIQTACQTRDRLLPKLMNGEMEV